MGPIVPLFSDYMADLTAPGSRSMVTEKEPFFVSNNAIMRQANQIITTTVKLDDYQPTVNTLYTMSTFIEATAVML